MIGVLLMAALAQGSGGEPPRDSGAAAEAVMRAFFEDLSEERWLAAAERFHPEVAAWVHREQLAQARARAEREPVDPYPPDMPPEVRAYFEQRRAEREHQDVELWDPPWQEADSVQALSAVELMARILEWSDPRTEMRRVMRSQGAPPELEGYANVVEEGQRVIGSVVEADVAYVVYDAVSRFMPAAPLSGSAIAELRRFEGGWRIWTHVGQPVGWAGHANLSFALVGPVDAPPPDSVFRWPDAGEPALTAAVEGEGGIRFEIGEPGGGSVVLPPEAVEKLLEFLGQTHFRGGERPPDSDSPEE